MARLSGYNLLIGIIIALGGFSYGFGFGAFGTVTGFPGFYVYFNLDPTSSHAASILGAANGVFNAGGAFGALSQGVVADAIGRKKAIFVSAVFTIVGAALTAGAVNVGMMVAVRFLHGLGIGMVTCLGPLYLSETAPAHRRGFLSGLAPMGFAVGLFGISWIGVAAYYAEMTLQWRLPLAVAVVPSLVQLVGLIFVPESPRYLILKDCNDEARAVLEKMHHDPSDPSESSAHAEFSQILQQVQFDKTQDQSYLAMFTKPSWRRRTLSAMFLQFACMSSGVQGIVINLPRIFGSLGLSGVMPLVIFGIYTTVGVFGVLATILVVDKFGRRTCFLFGFPALALVLLAEGLLQREYLSTTHRGGLAACILFMFLFNVVYQTVDAPSFAWITEAFPTTIRAKGTSLAIFAFFLGSITYTSSAAVAFNNIGYRMYLIYMAFCIVITVIIYVYIPETKLIPMEEIGALFGDAVVSHMTADGHHLVEELQTQPDMGGPLGHQDRPKSGGPIHHVEKA